MGYILEVKQFADDLQSLGLRKESNQKRCKFLDVWLEHLSE